MGGISDCPQNYLPQPIVPSKEEKAKALAAIRAATVIATVGEAKARDAWSTAKTVFVALPPKSTPAEKKAAREAYESAAKGLRAAINYKEAALVLAVEVTKDVYHLRPPQEDFTNDARLNDPQGRKWLWSPHYSDRDQWDWRTEKWREPTDDELKADRELMEKKAFALHMGYAPGRRSAYTDPKTGEIHILRESFADPDLLAALIYHETSHWVDIVSRKGRELTPEEHYRSEKDAYARQATFMGNLGMDKTKIAATQAVADQYEKQEDDARERELTWSRIATDPRAEKYL